MPAPPIHVFLTTIASQPALRHRQEYILRILQTKNIPFDSYDLASDEEAKKLWRRKAPADKQQLPGILVGGVCPGSFTDFEEAVEFDELDTFLRRNDPWDPTVEEVRPPPPVKPIGVPGAASPSQMARPEHKRYFTPQGSPAPLRSKNDRVASGTHLKPTDPGYEQVVNELRHRNQAEFDIGDELSGFGLQGVKVTEDELLKLVEDLGLKGDEAGDLAKGLSGFTSLEGKEASVSDTKKEKEPDLFDNNRNAVPTDAQTANSGSHTESASAPAGVTNETPVENAITSHTESADGEKQGSSDEAASDRQDKEEP